MARTTRLSWKRGASYLLLAATVFLFALALFVMLRGSSSKHYRLRLTAGSRSGTREKLAEYFVEAARQANLQLDLVKTVGSVDTLEKIDAREIDIALVQGGIRLPRDTSVRQIAVIAAEPLHLLVRENLFARVSNNLGTLQDRTINLGQRGSGTNLLSLQVLRFAGLTPGQEGDGTGFNATHLSSDAILRQLGAIDRAEGAARRQLIERLPDAFCSVSLLPSLVAKRLVEAANYRLVALPFAKAFSMVSVEEETHDSDRIEELHIHAVTIPTFTYGVSPPVPSEACQTIGTRLLVVAHQDVPDEAVSRLLSIIYEGPVEALFNPPKPAATPREYQLHSGAAKYRDRNKPFLRADVVEAFHRVASALAPVLGGLLALFGYIRWRRVLRFESYFQKVTQIKMTAKGFKPDETSPQDRDDLHRSLEEQLDDLQEEAIQDFSDGYFQGEGVVFALLSLIRDTREWLKDHQTTASTRSRGPATFDPAEGETADPATDC
jgi:TRAP-type uncharacterized transport system substrate-binding protein